jgi:hypothetical protein
MAVSHIAGSLGFWRDPMRAVSFPFFLASFFFSATQSQAAALDLPEGTKVFVQSSQLGPGWHIGRVEFTREGCAMV